MVDSGVGVAKTGHRGRLVKVIIVIVPVILVAAVCLAAWLFVDSTRAVDEYIDNVDRQYREISEGDNVEQANVKLRSVWLGELVNPKYKKVKNLESDYQSLVDALRNYTMVMNMHNQLVSKFNDGIEGNEVLNADIFDLANQMSALVHNLYPDRTNEATSIDELCRTIASSTSFADISGDVNRVLRSNEQWLASEREIIESARANFQANINSV